MHCKQLCINVLYYFVCSITLTLRLYVAVCQSFIRLPCLLLADLRLWHDAHNGWKSLSQKPWPSLTGCMWSVTVASDVHGVPSFSTPAHIGLIFRNDLLNLRHVVLLYRSSRSTNVRAARMVGLRLGIYAMCLGCCVYSPYSTIQTHTETHTVCIRFCNGYVVHIQVVAK